MKGLLSPVYRYRNEASLSKANSSEVAGLGCTHRLGGLTCECLKPLHRGRISEHREHGPSNRVPVPALSLSSCVMSGK